MKKKIGFISKDNPQNIQAWSGTKKSFCSILHKKYEIIWIGSCDIKLINYALKVRDFIKKFFDKNSSGSQSIIYSKLIGNKLTRKLKKIDCDILFAPVASREIAYLRTNKPIVYLSDATFKLMVDYYWFGLSKTSLEVGNGIEKRALENANHVIYSSIWAANSATNDYEINPTKISVIPFGPNIKKIPNMTEINQYKKGEAIRLLFMGVDWERKGGKIAVEAFYELRKMGLKVELVIVGSNPNIVEQGIKIIPFLDKNNDDHLNKIYELLSQSDFLILPTRAECSPIVFCEASAYGLPIITSDTGGLSSYVENGLNGYRLPLENNGFDYAKKIKECFEDDKKYFELKRLAREKYNNELNWNKWLLEFDKIIQMLIKENT
ncbi:glycosyltransferase family 4 protein [Peribacillus frigoritolerans]|uniref:glycosyltransferase family 4 protein n=1 Tax=Peribacillus frigoritolerans TaxID=450367 RepID=UPI0021D14378|nr:glycosyltransferase family 4 protein [Peribacillus frigoritolerans]MCU6600462.1 glycosyltransferase family 4 protein [Peribacillus frigoritolerans]